MPVLKPNPYMQNGCYARPSTAGMAPLDFAALTVAESVHGQDIRKKDLPQDMAPLKGLTHQYLTRRLLTLVGVTDPEILATASVHDVIEDHKYWDRLRIPFSERAVKLKWHLVRAMPTMEGFTPDMDAKLVPTSILEPAERIARRTLNLSNPDFMPEGKRIYQTDKVSAHNKDALNEEECLVKLADQAASVICDIITPSNKPDKGLAYAAKGWSLGQACALRADGTYISEQHEWLFNIIKLATMRLQAIARMDPEDAAYERELFTRKELDNLVAEAEGKIGKSAPAESAPEEYSITRSEAKPSKGLVGVSFTRGHQVGGFKIRCAPEKGKDDAVNHPVGQLIAAIEGDAKRHNIIVSMGRPVDRARQMRLARPMEWADFCDKAQRAGALDMDFQREILSGRGAKQQQR